MFARFQYIGLSEELLESCVTLLSGIYEFGYPCLISKYLSGNLKKECLTPRKFSPACWKDK